MNALILVDLQYDFMPGGPLGVPHGDEVIPVANRLATADTAVPRVAYRFDLVVATQDWHPPNHGSFATQHPGHKPGDVIDLAGQRQILWPVHCVQDTPGAALVAELDTRRIARIIHKGTDAAIDSYSAFFDNGHRQATGLGEFLKQQGVTDVYLLGLATDYCVRYSALDALQLGFRTFVIEDGCRGVNLQPGDSAAAIAELSAAGAGITTSRDLP
jgi:nicotinamidase/pyrazinamidase